MEYDEKWTNWLQGKIGDNVTLHYFPYTSDNYVHHIATSKVKYDLVVVDGRRRNECVQACLENVAPNGVVIYDDTHRDKYQEGTVLLEAAGFKRLDFWGFANGNIELKCTSLFYRAENCLGL